MKFKLVYLLLIGVGIVLFELGTEACLVGMFATWCVYCIGGLFTKKATYTFCAVSYILAFIFMLIPSSVIAAVSPSIITSNTLLITLVACATGSVATVIDDNFKAVDNAKKV